MPYEKGGRADKQGNSYEDLFTVKFLLKLVEEELSTVIIEPIGEEEEGVDLQVKTIDGKIELYQCKGRNGSNESWQMCDLAAKGIFVKAKKQLDADTCYSYYFVSPLTNTLFKDIVNRAKNSSGDPEHFYKHQITYQYNRNDRAVEDTFNSFCKYMGLNSQDVDDRAIAYSYLRRMELILFPDDSESKNDRLKDIRHLFIGNANSLYSVIAKYAIESNLLGCEITASMLVEYLERNPDVSLRRLNSDVRILPRIKLLNAEFSASFLPINDSLIQRTEVAHIRDGVASGTSFIVHGKAGCGKSGVAFTLANALMSDGTTYLALRLDRRIPESNAEHYGETLGLSASPVLCLDSISPDNSAVLILDQLDAVRWTSMHSSASLAVLKEMIDEIVHLNKKRTKKLSLILVCRTFDYRNDRGIRNLLQTKSERNCEIGWREIEIGELDSSAVANILGSKYESIPPKLRELLRTPNNLYIWTNIKNTDSLSAIKSASDFVGAWWVELRNNYALQGNDANRLDNLKDRIIDIIDRTGKLFVPDMLLSDADPLARSYLISSGMLMAAESAIGFSHQSFYDFFIMEKMFKRLYNQSSILNILGGKEKQTPLRRYHLQMLLENILEADVDKFLEIGNNLLNDPNVRFIMKHAYLAVLGQANKFNIQILSFAIELYNDPYWKQHILDTVFFGNAQAVMALINDGHIAEWISSEADCDTALKLLRSVNTRIQDEITSILNGFAFMSDAMDEKLYNVLCWDLVDDSDLMFGFRLQLIKHNIGIMQRFLHWGNLLEKNPRRAFTLFKLIVFEKDSIPNLNNHHIDIDDVGNLKRIAESEAAQTWQELMPFLLEQTQGLTNRYDDGFQFWETIQYPKQVFGRIFIELIKTAAAALIRENPACFIELSEPYHDCDSIVINEILLFIMNELPQKHSDFVVAWFIDNPQKHFFEYTSENDEHLTLAMTAISKHSRDCSVELFAQLETAIYYYHEKNEYENAKWRFKYNHDRRESSTNEMFFYSYWGEVQYYLLNALDETRISGKTKNLIKVLSRKFAYPPASHVRTKTTGGMVHSSISDAADKISDAQWLRIISNNKSSRQKYAMNESRGRLIESSPMFFARNLENLGEKDPNRVANLALRFDEDVDFNYVNAVFSTIGKTEQNEKAKDTITWRMVDKDIAERLFLKFGNRLDVATEYSRAIEKRSSEDWSDDVLFRLSEIAIKHPNPEKGKWNIYSSTDKECETVNSLITNSMNCTRGCATIAIGSLLWENKARYSVLESAIKAAVFDDHLAVNMAAIECILPMCNFDTDTAINWFSYLIEKDIRLGAHYSARNIYYHIFIEHKELVKQTVLKMYYAEYDDVSETGAKYIANIYFLYGEFGDVIFSETRKTSAQTKGILYISIELLKYPEHFEKSKEIIEFFIEHVDSEASIMLSKILECDTVDAKNDKDFIIKIVTSKRSRLMMHCLSDYIEKNNSSLVDYADVIFAICDNLVKQTKNGTEDPSSDLYGIAEPISKLIAKLYEQSKDYPDSSEINQRCLDMWDLMFEYRIGTIRELSQSIMEL